jgi:hypothetical protein
VEVGKKKENIKFEPNAAVNQNAAIKTQYCHQSIF